MEQKGRINILYLDDEVNNLISFKALFRLKYDVHVALNVNEAIQILENNNIQVLLTDQRMPGISGLEFVDMIEAKYPHVICVLVTGYASYKQVKAALDTGKICGCLDKPWDEVLLEEILLEAYARHTTQKKIQSHESKSTNLILTPSANPSIISAVA